MLRLLNKCFIMESDRRIPKVCPRSFGNTSKNIITPVGDKSSIKPTVNKPVVNSSAQLYQPFVLEYTLMAEYKQLKNQNLPGIYVVPAAKTPLEWFGVMFIRQGFYQGGILKFILNIPETYPDCDTPSIVFQPPVFHPLVDVETGEMDVKRSFPNWRRNKHQLWHVLQYARRAFYKIDSSLPKNAQASVFFENDIDLFKAKVADCLDMCNKKLYDPQDADDPHAIIFANYDPVVHTEFMDKLKNQVTKENEAKNEQTSGLSFVGAGSNAIFTKSVS